MASTSGTTILDDDGKTFLQEDGKDLLSDGLSDCECCGEPFVCADCPIIFICSYTYQMFYPNGLPEDDGSDCFVGNWGGGWILTETCHWNPEQNTAPTSGFGCSYVEIDNSVSTMDFDGTYLTIEIWTVTGFLLWAGTSVANPTTPVEVFYTAGAAVSVTSITVGCSRSEPVSCDACPPTIFVNIGGDMGDSGCDELVPNDGYALARVNCVWTSDASILPYRITVFRNGGTYDQWIGRIENTGIGVVDQAFVAPGCPIIDCPPRTGIGVSYNPIHRDWVNRTFVVS